MTDRPEENQFKSVEEYNAALLKYIIKLEKEIKFIQEVQTPDYERVQRELWNYQRALRSACEGLNEYTNINVGVLEEGYLNGE